MAKIEENDIAFRIEEGENAIDISMWEERSEDPEEIEFTYYECYIGGYGIGCHEFVSRHDLKNMADGIRDVLYKRRDSFCYACLDDVFRIRLSYDWQSDSYTFAAELIDTLAAALIDTQLGNYYISAQKSDLSEAALEAYTFPFFEWEKQYPIKAEKESSPQKPRRV